MSAEQSRVEITRLELMNALSAIKIENGYRNEVVMVSSVPTWELESSFPRISVVMGSGKIEMINQDQNNPVFDNRVDVWVYGYFQTGGPQALLKDPNVDAGDSLLHDIKRCLADTWKTHAGGSAVVASNRWQLAKTADEHRFYVPAENRGFVLLKTAVLIYANDTDW